jgi:hypothetical protein
VDAGIVPKDELEKILEMHNNLKKQKNDIVVQGSFQLKDGSTLKTDITYIPLLNKDGNCDKILGIAKMNEQ